jgi:hypothetical protein
VPDGLTVAQYEEAELEMHQRPSRAGFVIHALIYVVAQAAFVTINLINDEVIWFPYVMIGWGIGLLLHFLTGVRWTVADLRHHQEVVEKRARDRLAG